MTGPLFVAAAAAMLAIAVPYVWRVIAGPTVFDRLVGLNGIGTKVAVLVVIAGLAYDRVDMFVDLALGFLLLNIVTTLLIAKHVRRTRRA